MEIETFLAWAGLIVFAILLYKYTKVILWLGIGGAVLIGSIFGGVMYLEYRESQARKAQEEKVTLTMTYDAEECSEENRPFYTKITNGSDMVINKILWHVAVYRTGRSTNIVDDSGEGWASYDTRYHSDHIMRPDDTVNGCLLAPPLVGDYKPGELIYKVTNKSITFASDT